MRVAKVKFALVTALMVVVDPGLSVPQTMFPCESVSSVLQEMREESESADPEAFVKFTRPVKVDVPETERLVIEVVVNVPWPMESIRVVPPVRRDAFTRFTLPFTVLVPSVDVPVTIRFEIVVDASDTVPMLVILIAEVEPTCRFMMSAAFALRAKFPPI